MTDRVPFKPYLLRAFHQWLTEIGETPQILVNCAIAGVNVPVGSIKDGRIILNISYSAAHNLFISDSEITFGSRFGNNQMQVKVPMEAVLLIYSRETGDSVPFISTKDIKSDKGKLADNEDSSANPSPEPQNSEREYLQPGSPKMNPEHDRPKNQTLVCGIEKGRMANISAKSTRDTSHLRVIK